MAEEPLCDLGFSVAVDAADEAVLHLCGSLLELALPPVSTSMFLLLPSPLLRKHALLCLQSHTPSVSLLPRVILLAFVLDFFILLGPTPLSCAGSKSPETNSSLAQRLTDTRRVRIERWVPFGIIINMCRRQKRPGCLVESLRLARETRPSHREVSMLTDGQGGTTWRWKKHATLQGLSTRTKPP